MIEAITNLDDYRPHFAVFDSVDNKAHALPVALVRDIVNGDLALADCDESMVRGLLRMLLEEVDE